jgi:hypothetical protein
VRKQDIRTGVVYAYQQRASGIREPEPAVLLSTKLHTGRSRRRLETGPWCTPAASYEKPGRDYLGAPTGYPALFAANGIPLPDLISLMLSVTPDVLVTGEPPAGITLQILTSLTHLRGVYADVAAGHAERRRTEAEQNERERAERQARQRRAKAVTAALGRCGVLASYDEWDVTVTLALDEAEKLATLLEAGS